MTINWQALMQAPDIGQAVQQGIQMGAQMRRQQTVGNALAAYAKNPDDPTAVNALIQAEPRLGMQIKQQQIEQQRVQRIGQVQQRAAQGDPAALAELSGLDFDAWSKLDTKSQAKFKQQTDYIGEAALAISQLPEDQRPGAWESYIENGVRQGMEGLAQYKGKYSPETLNGALASAGKIKQFLDTQKIDWHQVGERPSFATDAMGRPIGSQNPYSASVGTAPAPSGDIPTIADPAQAKQLPPGTQFRTPDGRILRVPGGASQFGSPTFPQSR